jgi:hypothetical protein
VEYYATVFIIEESPLSPKVIWTGSDDGKVYLTRDGGVKWDDVTPKDMVKFTRVSSVDASRFGECIAYVAGNRFQLDDNRPYLWKTTNCGATWTRIDNGIDASEFTRVVREDPNKRGLLVAGTERGVWYSTNDGANWQSLRLNLPIVPVHDLAFASGDIVVATHGRGFYVMDDIVPLRALAGNAVPGLHLFPQATAVRLNEPGFTGTPMPKDEPLAPNPPMGAMIDYALPPGIAGPVEIAIYGKAGALVNRFNSTDPVKPIDLSKLAVAPEWVVSPKPPSAEPGHHRFVWDLHYAKPAGLKDERTPEGVWAPPGRYVVELRAAGQALRQPLTVVADPRVTVSEPDFDAEFRLAKQIEQARVRVRSMLAQASELKARLKANPQEAPLTAQLDALVGEDAPIGGKMPPTTLTSISEWLDSLAQAVDGADGAPTPDNLQGFAQVSGALQQIEPRWRAFQSSVPS